MRVLGVTRCPECDAELTPVESDDGRPVQTMSQSCTSCKYETQIALLWYQTAHEIVADVSDVDAEDGVETVVVDRDGVTIRRYESGETRAHHETALRQLS